MQVKIEVCELNGDVDKTFGPMGEVKAKKVWDGLIQKVDLDNYQLGWVETNENNLNQD